MKNQTTARNQRVTPWSARQITLSLTALGLGGTLLFATGCSRERSVAASTSESDTAAVEATSSGTTGSAGPSSAATTSRTTEEQLQPTGRTSQDQTAMVLDEEKLNVEKRETEAGGVLITKDVETRTVSQPVELREEKVAVERLSPEEAKQRGIEVQDQAQRIGEEQVYIPLSREQAVVQKEVQPREVVTANTGSETRQENVEATLRREVVDVERRGQIEKEQASTQMSQQGGQLEQRIRSELRNAQDLGLQEQQINQLQIRVEGGTVTLSGNVPSQDAASQIEQRVSQMDGVENVRNELRALR